MKQFFSKTIFFVAILVVANLFFSSNAFAQRFAVASGNWNGPIWATTAGGVAGSAATPTIATAVTVNRGVTVAMNVAGSCASLTLAGGATSGSAITGGSTLTLGGDVTVNNAATGTSGAVVSCPVALGNTNRTITVADDGTPSTDLTMSGVITAGAAIGFTKAGTGTFLISGNNTYTGITTINGGILKLGAGGGPTNSPLGRTNGRTIISSGASLDMNGFTLGIAEPLTLNGTGISNGGALVNSAVAAASYSGLILLGSTSSIIANAGDISISNAGIITGATFGLTLGGSGNGTIASSIRTTTGSLTKNGAGTWTLTGASTYTGATIITTGTLKIGGGTNIANTSPLQLMEYWIWRVPVKPSDHWLVPAP